jgi:ElaB/YqjD/DUF883 family membrane-anchored ribosome-binding protein
MNKNDVGSAAQTTDEKLDTLKGAVKGLVDQGVQKVDALKNKVVEAKQEAITRGSDILERVTDLIKAHPIKAVAIAFGAGYLGMRLFRFRR